MEHIINLVMNNRASSKPIFSAWKIACEQLGFNNTSPEFKFIGLLSAHEDLSIIKNKYHNYLHAADAIICSSELVDLEFNEKSKKQKFGFILMVAMLFHDIEHNGKTNKYDYELETIASNSFEIFMKNHKTLNFFWNDNLKEKHGNINIFIDNVKDVILGTDFKVGVLNNAQNYTASDLNRIKVLANEADILMSCSAELGPVLGKYLSEEQQNDLVGSWRGREFFLEKLAIFTSDSSHKLGIRNIIDNQLKAIKNLNSNNLDSEFNNSFEKTQEIVYNEYKRLSFDNKKTIKI